MATVKKETSPQTDKKADALTWNTIHIFGYGETQIIGSNHNDKIVNTELEALEPLLVTLAEKQQKDLNVLHGMK